MLVEFWSVGHLVWDKDHASCQHKYDGNAEKGENLVQISVTCYEIKSFSHTHIVWTVNKKQNVSIR